MLEDLWPDWRREWVVYEDDALVAVDKPAGVHVAPAERGRTDDACSRLRAWQQQGSPGQPAYAGVVHGMDHQISGLVVYSRRQAANRALAAQLERGVRRRYRLVLAAPAAAELEQSELPAGSEHRVVARSDAAVLVELTTAARSQPVRRWLAEIGAPIAGDHANQGPAASRLLLHVHQMSLEHPVTGEALDLSAPEPACFADWLAAAGAWDYRDEDALERSLREAAGRRYELGHAADTTVFRLVNGSGDGLPGIVIDRYGDYFVVALTGPAAAHGETILDAAARLGPAGIYLKLPPKQANITAARRAELAPAEPVRGQAAPQPLVVAERGLSFETRLDDGLATGLFLDQRDNRGRVRELARKSRVLNLFGYTGAFSVAAIAGGATHTVTVDSSATALAWAERHIARAGGLRRDHRFARDDARRWLERAARGREQFDLIVLDPPSFSTTKRHGAFRAARDYRQLAAAAIRCLAPSGRLLACTNHRGVTIAKLRREISAATKDARRQLISQRKLPDPVDFPPPPGEPCHLKALLVQVR